MQRFLAAGSRAFQQCSGRPVIPVARLGDLSNGILASIPGTIPCYKHTPNTPSPRTTFSETSVDIDSRRPNYDTAIDIAEREYRTRYQPTYHREEARTTFSDSTVDSGRFPQQSQQSSFVEDSTTVDAPLARPQGSTYSRKSTKIVEDIVEPQAITRKSNKMGYYDEEGEFPFDSQFLSSIPMHFFFFAFPCLPSPPRRDRFFPGSLFP